MARPDSPPEALMGQYLADALARFGGAVEIVPHFRWRFLRDFNWESDFAVIVGGRRTILIEVDGRRYHEADKQFLRDRQKDRDAMWLGYRVFRYAASEVYGSPGEIRMEIAEMAQGIGLSLASELAHFNASAKAR